MKASTSESSRVFRIYKILHFKWDFQNLKDTCQYLSSWWDRMWTHTQIDKTNTSAVFKNSSNLFDLAKGSSHVEQ